MFLQLLETLSCTIEKFEPVHIILCRWSFHQLFFIIACGWFFVYKRLIEVILMKFGLDSKRILQISMIDELGVVALIVVDGSKYNHSVTASLFQFTWFISLQASLARSSEGSTDESEQGRAGMAVFGYKSIRLSSRAFSRVVSNSMV